MGRLKSGGINVLTENGLEFHSWEEIDSAEKERRAKRIVKKNRNEITLPIYDVLGNPYVIERSRCKTPQQCLDWIHQISTKPCVWEDEARIMREFIEVLFEAIPSHFWAGKA